MGDSDPSKQQRSPWRNWLASLMARDDSLPPGLANRRASERRRHSLWSFAYGSFRPRRRIGRRHRDHERVFFDWHEPRVLYLAIAILLMCCTDALLTLNLLAHGAEEMNALMAALITHDVERFLALKIGVTGASVVLLGVAARRQFLRVIPVFRVLQLFCAGYAVLILWELWLIVYYVSDIPELWKAWQ